MYLELKNNDVLLDIRRLMLIHVGGDGAENAYHDDDDDNAPVVALFGYVHCIYIIHRLRTELFRPPSPALFFLVGAHSAALVGHRVLPEVTPEIQIALSVPSGCDKVVVWHSLPFSVGPIKDDGLSSNPSSNSVFSCNLFVRTSK